MGIDDLEIPSIFAILIKTQLMKTIFESIKTLLSSFDKPSATTSKLIESNLLEKWWLNDEILDAVEVPVPEKIQAELGSS